MGLFMTTSHDLENSITLYTREFINYKCLVNFVYTNLSVDGFGCSVIIPAWSDYHAQVVNMKLLNLSDADHSSIHFDGLFLMIMPGYSNIC